MGSKPFAAIFLISMFALPIGCGDDDDGGDSPGKGGASAGKAGASSKAGTGNLGGTDGGGAGGSDVGAAGTEEPGTGGTSAGSGGADAGGGGLPGEDGGAGAGDGGVGGAGVGGAGEGGQAGAESAGGTGGADGGPTVLEQIEELTAKVCSTEPAGGACDSNFNCVELDIGLLAFFTNEEDPAPCDAWRLSVLQCLDGRAEEFPEEFVCTDGELDITAAWDSGNDDCQVFSGEPPASCSL